MGKDYLKKNKIAFDKPQSVSYTFNTDLIFEIENIDENDKKLILQFFSIKKLFNKL